MYDYLIVGAGLFGAVCARQLMDAGERCLVIEKRHHVGGNCYTRYEDGINVHEYGAHIFHTSKDDVWQYVNKYVNFAPFINSPVANHGGRIYSLPINMHTFAELWGVTTPEEAKAKIAEQAISIDGVAKNVEELALSMYGRDVYEAIIKGYTEKQWGRPCTDLPAFILSRVPARFTYDNNYFNSRYQGIPSGGYTSLIMELLRGADVVLDCDYLKDRNVLNKFAQYVIYTGPIDAYFGFNRGALEWRSLRFEHERFDVQNMQGVAVMNYTSRDVPYTRTIEHKFFDSKAADLSHTIVSKEYPQAWEIGTECFYPIEDQKNKNLRNEYKKQAATERNISFAGRLGGYEYVDMDKTVENAISLCSMLLNCRRMQY